MKIAIFGGSFDPIHIAHKAIVDLALQNLDIHKLVVVPTYLNPFKDSFLFEPKIRYEFLKKVFSNYDKVDICDYEIKNEKASYTFDTVNYIRSLFNPSKIYLIIGEDNLSTLHNWHRFDELKNLVEFVVATRGNFCVNNHKFITLNVNIDISSTILRENLDLKFIPSVIHNDILNLKKGEKLSSRVDNIKSILDDKKAVDVEIFDLKSSDYLVDYVVIATTLNPKHAFALIDYLKADLKPKGEEFLRVDEDEDWTVIDLGDIFIHLMSEKYRAKYSLEDFLKDFQKNRA